MGLRNLVALIRSQGLRWLGVGGFVALWQLATTLELLGPTFGPAFGPLRAAEAFVRMAADGVMMDQAGASLGRFGLGLGVATILGAGLGLVVGYFRSFEELTAIVFQFLRMISPLALVPIALIAFGVGGRPVIFLVAYAALWPVLLSTAHGVSRASDAWRRVVRGFGGGHRSVLSKVVFPAVVPDLLQGIRLALGIGWVVLVPAEMLGVDSGLGYYVLDARDRFAYDELLATIAVIGILGYSFDTLLRRAKERFSWAI